MSQLKKNPKKVIGEAKKSTRVNYTAITILAALLVLIVCGAILLTYTNTNRIRESALAQSKESLDKNEFDLALRHLDRYLADNPDDIKVLEAKADLLSRTAGSADRFLQATQVHDQLIRLDPDGKGRLTTRRRLIELYITYGELIRMVADDLNDSRIEANESRYLAAVEAADELINYTDKTTGVVNGTVDASAHRLKAMAYMGQVPGLIAKKQEDSVVLAEAEKELDKALAIDPNDIIASEKLAELYMIHRKDSARFEITLDRMLDSLNQKKFDTVADRNKAALQVRISRFRAFYNTKDITKAQKELEAALEFAPDNVEILSSAAGLALQRNETEECRRYLDAIPAEYQDVLRVRLFRGELEFAERHPDEAIDQWRKGLSLVGGGNDDLTWRLAANLIQFGRLNEADPLVKQYLRLAKANDPKGLYLEGMYEEKAGHINKAIEKMEKASKTVPDAFRSDVLMSLGHCYEMIGDDNKAMFTYKSAANLGGAATGPRRAMARLHLVTNPARAIEELETAYAASKSNARSKITPAEGASLVLIPNLKDASGLSNAGKNQVVVASINNLLSFRMFDSDGKVVVDTDEKRLKDKVRQIDEFRLQLEKLWPPHALTKRESEDAIYTVTSIVDPTTKDAKGDPNILIDLIRIKLDAQMKLNKADRDFREVAKLLAEAQEIAPLNPAIQGLMAQYQSYSNRLDLAAKTLENTVKGINRKRVEAWLAYAEAVELQGNTKDAIAVLDQGSAPDAAGDHAAIRANKSRLLVKIGQASKAEEVLTSNIDHIPAAEQPDLYRALGDLCQERGKREEARDAYVKWSKLAPESPFPALKLLSIAQLEGDDESAKIGLRLLSELQRSDEPYGLAAQALQILRVRPGKTSVMPDDLAKAQGFVKKLDEKAPDFPVKYMIQGMIYEAQADPKTPEQWRDYMTKAGEAYRKSIKVGANSPALPKLIEIYMKLEDKDKLNLLKIEYDDGTRRNKTEIAMEFDRLSTMIALKLRKNKFAEESLVNLAKGQPDNPEVRFAEAQVFLANNKIDEAEATLIDLNRARPENPITWLELIRFQAAKRKPADVARTIEQARQKYTGERPELLIAQCYWLGKDIPNATREFQRAQNLRPNDVTTLKALVAFHESVHHEEQVDLLLRQILKIDPKLTWAIRTLALRLSARSDQAAWDEAWKLVTPTEGQNGEAPEDRLIRATILARCPESARRDEAIPAFSSLVNDLPLSNAVGMEARIRLSKAMLDLERPLDAWQFINPVCDDVSRPNPNALAMGIEALSRLRRGEEAEKRLSRLSPLIPDTTQLAVSQAWVAYALGKKTEASAALLSAFEKVEKEPDAELLGNDYLNLMLKFGDNETALTFAKKLAARWPRQMGNLARVQVARKEFDDALVSCRATLDKGFPREAAQFATAAALGRRQDKSFLKKAEEIASLGRGKAPNDYAILIYMATLRHMQALYKEELSFYRMALEMNPPNRQFLNNMAWTLSEGDEHQPEEALKLIENVIKFDGASDQYLDTRGVIQTRLKNYDKAISDLEKSIEKNPFPVTYFHLARAYFKAGRLEDSHRARDIGLSKGFDFDTLDPTDKTDFEAVMFKP